MAEIKSTLEKVMERLAAMDSGPSAVDLDREEQVKAGMRMAAAYLRGEEIDLGQISTEEPTQEGSAHCQGAVKALLRNIVLPREEDMTQTERALQGIIEVGGGAGDLVDVAREMKMLFDHYRTQKADLRQQLEAALYQQLQQSMGQQFAEAEQMGMKIDPTQHPKFHEEWQRIMAGLNEQYGAALYQHKNLILQRLT